MVAPRAGTELAAANDALAHCKQPPIGDLGETNNRAAAVSAHFASVRDSLLAEHEWGFATAYATPAQQSPDSLGTFKRRFALPADCIQVRYVDGLGANEWGMEAAQGSETKTLVTNATAPLVCYTKRVETPALWDPLFLDVFALRLGAKVAPLIAKSEDLSRQLDDEATEKLQKATLADAREKAPQRSASETSWIRARR